MGPFHGWQYPSLSRPKWSAMLTRWTVLLALLALIGLAQWITPMKGSVGLPYLAVHLLLRKLYLLPIILGAIWFELPGALAMALGASLVDLPALLAAWPGLPEERLEEWGGLGGMWIVAVVAGVEVHKARSILLRLNCALECTIESLVAALDIREQGTGLPLPRVCGKSVSGWRAGWVYPRESMKRSGMAHCCMTSARSAFPTRSF